MAKGRTMAGGRRSGTTADPGTPTAGVAQERAGRRSPPAAGPVPVSRRTAAGVATQRLAVGREGPGRGGRPGPAGSLGRPGGGAEPLDPPGPAALTGRRVRRVLPSLAGWGRRVLQAAGPAGSSGEGASGHRRALPAMGRPPRQGRATRAEPPPRTLLAGILHRLDELSWRWERISIGEYLALFHDPGRLFWMNFLAGVARGLGAAVGFTLLGALVLLALQRAVELNLPYIGSLVADLLRIVRTELDGGTTPGPGGAPPGP
ncbi:DUF5665 domain-containing protein [Thermaerobacter litoralis]